MKLAEGRDPSCRRGAGAGEGAGYSPVALSQPPGSWYRLNCNQVASTAHLLWWQREVDGEGRLWENRGPNPLLNSRIPRPPADLPVRLLRPDLGSPVEVRNLD